MHSLQSTLLLILVIVILYTGVNGMTQCQNATLDDLYAMPGYNQLLDRIGQDFGAVPHELEVNTKENHPIAHPVDGVGLADMHLDVCFLTGPYQVSDDDDPSHCATATTQISGYYQGTTGSMTVQVITGYTAITEFQTQRTSTMGGSITGHIDATKAGVGGDIGVTLDVANSLYHLSRAEVSSTQWIAAMANIGNNQKCDMYYNVTSCRHSVSISIPVSLAGWVQLDFHDKVTYAGFSYLAKYWWVNIGEKLFGLTQDQRTAHFVVGGDITLSSKGDVYVNCSNGDILPAILSPISDAPKNPALNADGHNVPQTPGKDNPDNVKQVPTSFGGGGNTPTRKRRRQNRL